MSTESEQRELVWVKKSQADRFKNIESDEKRYEAFEEYLKTVSEESRREFKTNFENLEEDVAIYNGLMLKVKQSFERAKHEQLTASYVLWENFEKEIPSVNKKVDQVLAVLSPLSEKLNKLNGILKAIEIYDVNRLIEAIEKLTNLYGTNKDMVEFLVNNFKRPA
jgi:archaellum component FlaC